MFTIKASNKEGALLIWQQLALEQNSIAKVTN